MTAAGGRKGAQMNGQVQELLLTPCPKWLVVRRGRHVNARVSELTIELVRQWRRSRRVVRTRPIHIRGSRTLRGLHDLEVLPVGRHEWCQVKRQGERAWVVHSEEASAFSL